MEQRPDEPDEALYAKLNKHVEQASREFRPTAIRELLGPKAAPGEFARTMAETGARAAGGFVQTLDDREVALLLMTPAFEEWRCGEEQRDYWNLVRSGADNKRRDALTTELTSWHIASYDHSYENLFNLAERPSGRAKLKAELIASDPDRSRRVATALGVKSQATKGSTGRAR